MSASRAAAKPGHGRVSAAAASARARLQPLDVESRRARRYQWLRRASLGLSLLFVVGLPLWQLRAVGAASGGLSAHGAWSSLASALRLPAAAPPFVGAPAAVSLFGLDFVDPLLTLGVAMAHGLRAHLLLTALPALALAVFLGRFFCGWVCPYVPLLAASNALRWLLARAGFTPLDVRIPRRSGLGVLVVLLVATAVLGTQVAPLFYPPCLIGREAFRAIFFGSFGAGVVLVGAIFAFDSFVSRAGFCRSLCPGGALFSLLASPSPFGVKRDATRCTDCTVCDVVCNLGQQPMVDGLDAGCERCGKCVSACPTGALSMGLAGRSTTPSREPR